MKMKQQNFNTQNIFIMKISPHTVLIKCKYQVSDYSCALWYQCSPEKYLYIITYQLDFGKCYGLCLQTKWTTRQCHYSTFNTRKPCSNKLVNPKFPFAWFQKDIANLKRMASMGGSTTLWPRGTQLCCPWLTSRQPKTSFPCKLENFIFFQRRCSTSRGRCSGTGCNCSVHRALINF